MIEYIQGDLFKSLPKDEPLIIPHVCNNKGSWGTGFVLAVSKWHSLPEKEYLEFFKDFKLGETQYVYVDDIIVANMIAQDGFPSAEKPRALNYVALLRCMTDVYTIAKLNGIKTICCPKFGSGISGGDWRMIEHYIEGVWHTFDVKVFSL